MLGIKTRIVRFSKMSKTLLRNYYILGAKYGQWKSAYREECVDGDGNHTPWFTYPAIEYLKQLDLSDKRVFEFGSGYSTLFWAKNAKSVVSVEDDRSWYERLKPKMPSNVEYMHAGDFDAYVNAINRFGREFDIIVNDGLYRLDCAKASLPKLTEAGFIILDNSDWCRRTTAFYRENDLIEVDMAGFSPINEYTMMTSFFFSRKVQLKPAHDRQPMWGTGAEIVPDSDLEEFVRG